MFSGFGVLMDQGVGGAINAVITYMVSWRCLGKRAAKALF